jgi:hypothetical protein
VSEDWRVTVRIRDEHGVGALRRRLHEHEAEEETRDRLGDLVAVSSGGSNEVLLYTSTGEAAHEAGEVVAGILREHGLEGELQIDRWHPIEQRWEDEHVPLPETEAQQEIEHDRLEGDEAAASRQLGEGLWQVRVEFDSHGDAVEFADRLVGEGLPVARRWTYLIVGAENEDEANALAERLQAELPEGAALQIEPGGGMTWPTSARNPFAVVASVFGGLSG